MKYQPSQRRLHMGCGENLVGRLRVPEPRPESATAQSAPRRENAAPRRGRR
jgi:hypothetical protein